MQNEYTVGSLFSGIGGIEIGFEKEGFKTKWFIEKEPYAQAILKKRFPGTKVYEDVTTIDFRTIQKVDILTGGFPCQDISVAGKQVGIEGSRSSLWKYYLKAIRILQPRFALIENVSALAIRGLDVVLTDLAEIGYDAEWYNLSASAAGAFHKRERIFIIAYPNSNWKSDESFNEGEGQGFVDDVSNPNIRQCNRTEEEVCSGWDTSNISSKDVSNTNNKRSEGEGEVQIRQSEFPRFKQEGYWYSEPELGRVANGIPNRMDRIKCLGNAVVPQCAEVFAKAIKMKLDSQTHGATK